MREYKWLVNAFRLTLIQVERGGGKGFFPRKFCKDPAGNIYGEALRGRRDIRFEKFNLSIHRYWFS